MSQPGDALDPFRNHDSGVFCSATIYHAATEAWGYADSHGCLRAAEYVLPCGEKFCASHYKRLGITPAVAALTRRVSCAAIPGEPEEG